jgi:hypothetical protein
MDKQAKSALLNMVTSTGFFGCTKYLQSGKSLKKIIDGNT